MGQVSYTKIGILIICFALTSVFIYCAPSSRAVNKQVPLSQALSEIKGWSSNEVTLLDPKIVEELELDDYINQSYSNSLGTISLYIGYYLTTKKIGAAHDPLVCFPGQGWVVSNTQESKLNINSSMDNSISYSTMTVERGLGKEVIIYWFQSYDQTRPNTFSQKVTSLWKKFSHHREDNAFVRISISLGEKSLTEARETAFEFIRSFYPVFLDYVKADYKSHKAK